jgi:hypothetical protein
VRRYKSAIYDTTCHNIFEFSSAAHPDNQLSYCPFCGGAVLAVDTLLATFEWPPPDRVADFQKILDAATDST